MENLARHILANPGQTLTVASFVQAEPWLSAGESLLLVEEGEGEFIEAEGARIRVSRSHAGWPEDDWPTLRYPVR
ncbi:MAG: hypothetical protein ACOYM2_05070 [Rectinemataceae bacterium]